MAIYLDPDKFENDLNPPENPASDEEIFEILYENGWDCLDPEMKPKFETWKAANNLK